VNIMRLLCLLLASIAVLAAGEAGKPREAPGQSQGAAAEAAPPSFDRRVQPLLSTYCYPCHNREKSKGDIDLEQDRNPTLMADRRKVWITALQALRDGEMPPEKSKQPSAAERQLIGDFIELTLGSLDCTQAADPGRPAVRRLNRVEYDNTVRALFGIDLPASRHFSPDGSSYGFDNIADALTVAPVQIEQYYDAAGKILDVVFRDRKALAAILIRQPGPGVDARLAAREVISAFATRAYRKPVDAAHLDQLMGVYDVASGAGKPFTVSVRAVMQAVLISPRFLMRIEDKDPKATAAYPVSAYDLASRLSYFLWSSPPDDELLRLAADNRLQDPAVLEQQALRMLKDRRGRALAENFAGQWLQLRELADHRPDTKAFPQFTPSLREAMLEEALLFITELIRYDRSIIELLDANYTFLNEELAKHYGIGGVKGTHMQRVALTDPRRGGVVTMAAVLTITADPGRTNIPRRGNYVMGTILGMPPPPPPPDVPQLEEPKAGEAPKTVREMLELHRTKPECAACHAKTDPLGFGLENFDAIGRWQDQQAGKPVDASGTLPGGERFDGPVQMKRILVARKQGFARGMSEAMLIYALGRGLQREDECVVKAALQALEDNDYRISALVTTIVRSLPFTHRRNAEY
jgi:cytochrome c553